MVEAMLLLLQEAEGEAATVMTARATTVRADHVGDSQEVTVEDRMVTTMDLVEVKEAEDRAVLAVAAEVEMVLLAEVQQRMSRSLGMRLFSVPDVMTK